MKKNISVVGCGHWGKNLVRNFSELGALASICDPSTEIANKYANEFNVENLSFKDIINSKMINGIVLAVPAYLHCSMALQALNAGKNVYVEKPLAMNQNDAENMIEAAKKNNVQLMVGHLLQYHPIFKKLKEIVNSGKIGSLKYIYSNRLSFGKVIWSFAPHDISMILSLTNQKPEFVKFNSSFILQKKLADTATIHIEFKSGLKSHIFVSWLHPYKEHKIVVTGTSGTIIFDDTKNWNEKLALYPYEVNSSPKQIELKKQNVQYFSIPEEEPLKNECQHFIDVVHFNKKPITDGKEGLEVLKVLSATV